MLNELLVLKAEAEHEMLYAQAKLEVVEKLLAKVKPLPETVEQDVEFVPEVEIEGELAGVSELGEV